MTAQEAFREILDLFYQRLARDPQARAAMRRVERQTAAFEDTAQLSERASALLGEVFGEHVLDVPEELREAVCTALLRERYDTMNGILADVQEAADEALGLTLDAAHAPFPAERVQTVAHSLIDPGVTAATIQRRANKPVATVARSFHDDFIETNAKKRSDLGLRCHITRETDGKCCQWCDGLAGRYVYGRHPGDIFRRHDNCGCTVTYEEGRQRQDVWTKRSWERVDPEEVAAAAPEPTVFSREDAAAMEESLLSGLTLAGERDIMMIEAESPYKHPKTPLKIDSHMQGKHIRGEKRYNDYMQHHTIEPSYLTINMEKAQELVDKFHGSGILKLNKNGEILDSEIIIDNDEVVGVAVNNITGASQSTTAFKIKYGPNGTHIVPTYESQKKYFIERRRQDGHDWLLRQKS